MWIRKSKMLSCLDVQEVSGTRKQKLEPSTARLRHSGVRYGAGEAQLDFAAPSGQRHHGPLYPSCTAACVVADLGWTLKSRMMQKPAPRKQLSDPFQQSSHISQAPKHTYSLNHLTCSRSSRTLQKQAQAFPAHMHKHADHLVRPHREAHPRPRHCDPCVSCRLIKAQRLITQRLSAFFSPELT